MSKEELEKIKDKLIDVLSQEKGYFGRIDTWGRKPKQYEYIGYELDGDIMPTINLMSDKNKKCLIKIINYFEIHANPLKKILRESEGNGHDFYSELAWSHFMTVVMFGMLEFAVKNTPSCIIWKNQKKGYIEKFKSMELFLEKNLRQSVRESIAKRYKTEENKTLTSFSDVIRHLWEEVRSGFIHDADVHVYKGMEWSTFGGGIGTREDPIELQMDVPMQELLQITWQAILNSFGYKGSLELPIYKN